MKKVVHLPKNIFLSFWLAEAASAADISNSEKNHDSGLGNNGLGVFWWRHHISRRSLKLSISKNKSNFPYVTT